MAPGRGGARPGRGGQRRQAAATLPSDVRHARPGPELTDATDGPIPARQVSMGAEFQLTKGRVNIGLSPSWVLSMVMEEKVNPAVTVQISAQVDHQRPSYKFGFGMSVGGN